VDTTIFYIIPENLATPSRIGRDTLSRSRASKCLTKPRRSPRSVSVVKTGNWTTIPVSDWKEFDAAAARSAGRTGRAPIGSHRPIITTDKLGRCVVSTNPS
jgi:hypothetical protein